MDATPQPARIDRDALLGWIVEQADRIETTAIPEDLEDLGISVTHLPVCEVRAMWLAAGLASQIGIVLMREPGRFITPWPEQAPMDLGGFDSAPRA